MILFLEPRGLLHNPEEDNLLDWAKLVVNHCFRIIQGSLRHRQLLQVSLPLPQHSHKPHQPHRPHRPHLLQKDYSLHLVKLLHLKNQLKHLEGKLLQG